MSPAPDGRGAFNIMEGTYLGFEVLSVLVHPHAHLNTPKDVQTLEGRYGSKVSLADPLDVTPYTAKLIYRYGNRQSADILAMKS